MSEIDEVVPVVLFTYSRPDCLRQTLACLKENRVPLIYAFSDGPKRPELAERIAEVRKILRSIDWCELILCERDSNFGLGVSITTGVTEVLQKHEMIIVFEDDLICVRGTYDYLCKALHHYKYDERVMSVTGWTHPRITPTDVVDQPYFDGRAESLVWGTWGREWEGMDEDAMTLIKRCKKKGIDIYRYGADLVSDAHRELLSNIWAVRFLYLHILRGGSCMRPPWSMVEHIGGGSDGTNVKVDGEWEWNNPPLKACPQIPLRWPEPKEHNACTALWVAACGGKPTLARRGIRFGVRTLRALQNL